MKLFSKLFEDAKLASGEYKELKQLVLDKIGDADPSQSLTDLIKGFNNDIPIPFTTEELYSIWEKEIDSIDALLASIEWFDEMPSKRGIKSTKIYVIEATKRAFKEVCEMMLKEI